MSNKKMLKKIIAEDLSKTKNYNYIMNIIENSSSTKKAFKLRYAYAIAIILIAGVIGVSAAVGNIVKSYKIDTIDNLPYEESSEKRIKFDNKLDREYDSKLFKKAESYTYDEIEKKLQLKLLKNKNFDRNMYLLTNLEIKNDKIAQVAFWQVNSDKSRRFEGKYLFYFAITTNYFDEDNTAAIIGGKGGEYREHYIKSLDTLALITKSNGDIPCGPARVHFSYNEVVYGLRFEDVCFDGATTSATFGMTETELYDFLEAFTLD